MTAVFDFIDQTSDELNILSSIKSTGRITMDTLTLDKFLKKETQSEKKYKTGRGFYPYEKLPLVKRGKNLVRLMVVDSIINTTSNNLLNVKKQSRYQSIPMHAHDWIEINYMYSGCCPQIINDIPCILRKGQVMLIDTDIPHSTAALGEDDIMVSMLIEKEYFNSNFFNRLSCDSIISSFFINSMQENARHDNYILFHSENSRTVPLYFNEFLCEMFDPSINSEDMIQSLIILILCSLINSYEEDQERTELGINQNSIGPILRYIERNYKDCSLESTAASFNMNPNYLTTLLKQRTGHSYKDLVQQQRLQLAAQTLRNTDRSVTEIANNVGYENMSFFYKKFKTSYGCSPKEYRDLYRNHPGRNQ